MKQLLQKLAIRAAVWLLSQKYLMLSNDGETQALRTALHELQHENFQLRKEREHWRLRAVINEMKAH